MGKTPKPLTIAVSADLLGTPIGPVLVDALREKGHSVTVVAWPYDLILAPQACRFVPGMAFMLDEVVKGARKVKYPKEKA